MDIQKFTDMTATRYGTVSLTRDRYSIEFYLDGVPISLGVAETLVELDRGEAPEQVLVAAPYLSAQQLLEVMPRYVARHRQLIELDDQLMSSCPNSVGYTEELRKSRHLIDALCQRAGVPRMSASFREVLG